MSALRQAVGQYLSVRRALGFRLERETRLLPDFVVFCERAGHTTITTAAALAWATRPAEADPAWWNARLGMVRGFARWLAAFDSDTEVPAPDLLPARRRRAQPYLYTDAEVGALMRLAGSLPSPLRGATYQTLIGLLAVTGMRVGEAIALDSGDVDWDQELLVVRHAKFDKTREIVLHPSTVRALRAYAEVRDRCCPRPQAPAFFISLAGTRLIYNNVHYVFHQMLGQAGVRPRSHRCRPRIHDLRHRFAVITLLGWYRDDGDVSARLPQLSTYLGHVDPADTYWYLHAVPELLALAAGRLTALEMSR